MDNTPSRTSKKIIKKAVTFNEGDKPSRKSRKSSSHKKKGIKVKRESVLKPSVYRQIQKKRKSQSNNKKRISETFSKSPSICSSLSQTSSILTTNNNHNNNICNNSASIDNRRIVFISFRDFYNCWRLLSANILSDCILIFPLYREWIYDIESLIGYNNLEYFNILNDKQFIIFLQWKDRQGLLFYMLNHLNCKLGIENAINYQNNICNNSISAFWHNLSLKLQTLYDPDTCDSYRPLLLNERWWKYAYINMYESKYNVSSNQVLNELHFLTMKYKCIQEILYQSNPSLNVLITYNNINTMCSSNKNNNESNALQCIKTILNEPLNEPLNNQINDNISIKNEEELMDMIPKIEINEIENDNYLSCDTLQSPSDPSDIHKNTPINIMNSGSDDDINDHLNDINYDNTSSHSSDIFANITHNIMKNKGKNKSINSSNTSDNDTLDEHEWWVCPDYYYDTYKNSNSHSDNHSDY